MSLHPSVDVTGRLIQSLIAELTAGPMTEQRREDCRAIHRSMIAALNNALDLWGNGELTERDQEVLVTCSRMLGDIKTLVQQACSEMRRRFD